MHEEAKNVSTVAQPPLHPQDIQTRRNVWWGRGFVAAALLTLILGVIWGGPQFWSIIQDERALEAWVVSLGWLGPIALIAINATQIVFAPIPGYVMQLAAGYLYGPLWGGIWASLGLLIGGSLAFWLARLYGRPVVSRLIGDARLDRWESVTHSTSLIVWFILLLAPTGDAPFFLAGLARVSYWHILLLTLLIRVPSTFVVTAAGAGIMILSWQQLALVFVCLFALLVIFLRYQTAIVQWVDSRVQSRVQKQIDAPLPHDAQG